MDKKDIVTLTALFILAFWMWTLPIQDNPLPFGEADAAYHFGVSDYMYYNDRSMGLTGLPDYIAYKYYLQNEVLGKNALNSPPTYNLDFTFVQMLTNDRIIAPYILIAITSFLTVFSIYFLIRKLYGFLPATLVSSAVIFSIKDILTYLWGQRPNLLSFVFVPLLMYSFFKYIDSFYSGKDKPIYLYITALLFASSYLFHLAGGMLAIAVIFAFLVFITIKEKKIPINKSNIKHIIINILLIIAICAPFTMIYFGRGETNTDLGLQNVGRLFYWFKVPPDNLGLNPIYYSYKASYMGLWTIPLLLIGILTLLLKRSRKNLLMLGALAGMYFLLHLDVFGITKLSYRIARFLPFETPLFYLMIVFGMFTLISFIKIPFLKAKYIKLLVGIIFIVLLILTQGNQASNQLADAYVGLSRITPQQYDASMWILENTPDDSKILNVGTLTYPKQKFIQFLSHRYGLWLNDESVGIDGSFDSLNNRIKERGGNEIVNPTHVLVDYSDLAYLQGNPAYEPQINYVRTQEEDLIRRNATKLYDKNNIKLYELKK